MKIKILLYTLLLLSNNLFAQIGGTQAVEDTMRLADKFAVYKTKAGQSVKVSKIKSDSTRALAFLSVPKSTLPACDASSQGNIMMNTSDSKIYYCNGSTWNSLKYDNDQDGLVSTLDADDTTPFTAGTAINTDVIAGQTFYTGANMTLTTGAMPSDGTYYTPSYSNQTISAGYRNGGTYVRGSNESGFGTSSLGGKGDATGNNGPYKNCTCGYNGGLGYNITITNTGSSGVNVISPQLLIYNGERVAYGGRLTARTGCGLGWDGSTTGAARHYTYPMNNWSQYSNDTNCWPYRVDEFYCQP